MGETNFHSQDDFFEEIEHTADWAIRVSGKTIESLFENAALGMLRLMQVSSRPGESKVKHIEMDAIDKETLLVAWLEELLFNMETNDVNYTGIEVHQIKNGHLSASVREIPLAEMNKEIKAVTFYDLRIETTDKGFFTTLVFDV